MKLRRVMWVCICCRGTGYTLIGRSPWNEPVESICVRCNLAKCGHRDIILGGAHDIASWACSSRVGQPVLRYQGQR